MSKETSVITPKFRMSWPNLLTPKKNNLNGEIKYTVCAVFPPDVDLKALRVAAQAAARAKWGDKIPANLKSPFRSGNEETFSKYPEMKDKTIINMSSQTPPGVVDNKVQPVLDQKEVYGGRWAIAAINAYAYDRNGNRGISFGINHVQLLDHDTPFGNRTRAEDVFQKTDIQGSAKQEDDLFA